MPYTGSVSRGGPGSHDPSDGLERVHSSPLAVVETLSEFTKGSVQFMSKDPVPSCLFVRSYTIEIH